LDNLDRHEAEFSSVAPLPEGRSKGMLLCKTTDLSETTLAVTFQLLLDFPLLLTYHPLQSV